MRAPVSRRRVGAGPSLLLVVFLLALAAPGCRSQPQGPGVELFVVNLEAQALKVTELDGLIGRKVPVIVPPGQGVRLKVAAGTRDVAFEGAVKRQLKLQLPEGKVSVVSTRLEACWVVGQYDAWYEKKSDEVEIVAYGRGAPLYSFDKKAREAEILPPSQPFPKKKTRGKPLYRINPMNCGAAENPNPQILDYFARGGLTKGMEKRKLK